MSEIAIAAGGLGKRYRLGATAKYKTLREAVTGLFRAPAPGRRPRFDREFWALRDVSFDISRGETIGIIGRNGAGKSTLLKLLARVTAPTEGSFQIQGRIGSLLEVGVGFHPELTGRENIYLNGALLGMKKAEIERNFDEIVAFAEVEKFLDTQMKHYSSGMFVRLGFAVAAHLECEILFVDEVLAVGDTAFQEKCLGKMRDVAGRGRTVLMISHNLMAVQALCKRSLWLDQGRLVAEGPTAAVVAQYLDHVRNSRTEVCFAEPDRAPSVEGIRLHRAAVIPTGGGEESISVRTPLQIQFEFWNSQPGIPLYCGFNLLNECNVHVLSSGLLERRTFDAGLVRLTAEVPGDLLNAGVYRIEFLIWQNETRLILQCPDLLTFEVADSLELRGNYFGNWPGVVRPIFSWNVEMVVAPPEAEAH